MILPWLMLLGSEPLSGARCGQDARASKGPARGSFLLPAMRGSPHFGLRRAALRHRFGPPIKVWGAGVKLGFDSVEGS